MAKSKAKLFLVKDLVAATVQNGRLRRFDIFINYMAIENHYGKNECGWDLYEKYETAAHRKSSKSKNIFISLINSFEESGFVNKYALKISAKKFLHIRDGAHRLAAAMYFNCDKVTGRIRNQYSLGGNANINSDMLKRRKFTEDEIEIIKSKQEQIFKEMEIDNE